MEHLHGRYKDAFDAWAIEVRLLNQAREIASDGPGVSEGEYRSQAANAAYRETRDELAQELSPSHLSNT